MTTFSYELAALIATQGRHHPTAREPLYQVPWYLVVGEPQTGRTTVIRSLNLSWPFGEQPLATNVPGQLCEYWVPEKAVFLEPGPLVVGMARGPQTLMELCQELKVKRPRQPLDGVVLVIDARVLADASEEVVERYGKTLRRYLVEVGQALDADVPTYVVLTGLDVLWGFGDAFQWTADRVREESWGFVLPRSVRSVGASEHAARELEGLLARLESTCFAKLSSEEHLEVRTRAYQHLTELRDLLSKVGEVLAIVTSQNAFERSPWMRALAIGSGIPGSGHRLRHRSAQFGTMGYLQPPESGTLQPGGMPLHALLEKVLLPERDLVGTAKRWRDDKLTVVLAGFALVGWLAVAIGWIAFLLSHG
jgi:type VI protein secretion system component VasK